MAYRVRGLGVVMNPDGSYYVPGWCSWLPFSSFNDACKLPTPNQVRSDDLSNLGGAAHVGTLPEQWAATDEQAASNNPEMAQEIGFARDYPNASAAFGTGQFGQSVVAAGESIGDAAGSLNPSNWNFSVTTLLLLAVVAVIGISAVGAGSPRRYGR